MLRKFSKLERKLVAQGGFLAIDEAGRGALAGDLIVAGILVKSLIKVNFQVNDSKLLSPSTRKLIFNLIKKNFKYFIAKISPPLIDRYGILKAEILAIKRLITKTKPSKIVIDGLPFKNLSSKKFIFIVKGDRKLFSLACASIVAKVTRDNLMQRLSKIYPFWQLDKNKGYGTIDHLKLIKKHGLSPCHRRSFIPLNLLRYLEKKNSVF